MPVPPEAINVTEGLILRKPSVNSAKPVLSVTLKSYVKTQSPITYSEEPLVCVFHSSINRMQKECTFALNIDDILIICKNSKHML